MHGLSLYKLNEMRELNYNELSRNKGITSRRRKSYEESSEEKNPPTIKNFMIDMCSDPFINGHIIEYPHGIVMGHSETSYYYRGQTENFGACYSSLYREIRKCSGDEEKRRKIFLNQLRVNEFNHLISNFTQVKEWYFGDIFTYAIAQHYGFYTDIIDFTNDLDVALFFACCKHVGNNRYLPLTEEDIKSKKYGLLFQRPAIVNTQCFLNNYDPAKFNPRIFPIDYQPFTICNLFRRFTLVNDTCFTGNSPAILPIGYQPFTRCNKQRGYFIHTKFGEDIQAKSNFTVFRFKHSVKLSEELYSKYKGGEKLFNYDALNEISDLLEIIKTAKTFSNESFEDTYIQLHGKFTKEEWITNLKDVVIGKSPYDLSKEKIEAINKKWSVQKFINSEGLLPGFRKQFYD